MVHLRSKKFKGKKGRDRIYYYLIRDVYEGERKLQKVVRYIGTANKLQEKLNKLEKLEKEFEK